MEQHLPVDKQEVSDQAQQRGYSRRNGDVTLKKVLPENKQTKTVRGGILHEFQALNMA